MRTIGLTTTILLALAGCATTVTMASLSVADREALQVRPYNKPDSTIFTACVAALVDIGYTLRLTNRSLGK